MRTMIFIAAVATALSTAAMPGNDGPFSTSQWTNGLYAQQSDAQVGIFPNPASGQVNVIYPGLTGEATLTLITEDGRILRRQEIGQTEATLTQVDLSTLSNGICIVRVEQPSGMSISRRLVVSDAAQSVSP
ncbi:MAG: T9SS type A sorting domain-containing protein [Flavobacteriales bacterium]